jgi:glycosyltransferase involved in cell wall biosynthesis
MAEGFDLSGVEAMLCDTPVIASDIAVHRWTYGDAALYFSFDSGSLVRLLKQVGSHVKGGGVLAALRARGVRQAALYRPEVVASRWYAFLQGVQGPCKIH